MDGLYMGIMTPLENEPYIHIVKATPARKVDLVTFRAPEPITLEEGEYITLLSADSVKAFGYHMPDGCYEKEFLTISLLDIMENLR